MVYELRKLVVLVATAASPQLDVSCSAREAASSSLLPWVKGGSKDGSR